jgi:hypothetical protein
VRYARRERPTEPLARRLAAQVRARGLRPVAASGLRYLRIHAGRRLGRVWAFAVARALALRPAPEFSYDGESYRYVRHHHNTTWRNERAVELAIVGREVERAAGGAILEVGNVLERYVPRAHDVVDKYERAAGVLNVDILEFAPARRYDLIVSISTLEHVGWDEEDRDPGKVPRTVRHLRTLLAPGGRAIVTAPLGHNPHLDAAARSGTLGFDRIRYLRRTAMTSWAEASPQDVTHIAYGSPLPGGNAIMIGYLDGGLT